MNKDYDLIKKQWLAYWNKENNDRPILSILAPNGKTFDEQIKTSANIRDYWLDTEFVVKRLRRSVESTYFAAEAFPTCWANVGPDAIGALAGCTLEYTQDTVWAKHFVKDWNTLPPIEFNEDNFYYQKMVEITKALVKDANGEYLVGNTDIHAGADGLVAMRGPDRVCMDIFDNPDQFKKRIDELFLLEKKLYSKLNEIISAVQEGTTNWLGLLHPEKNWYPTSCDFSCMISTDDFEEFIIPGLMDEIKYYDASIYHLDGTGALHHLDRLLEIEELEGIQWIAGAGKPTARHWVGTLKKIQDAGKLICMGIESVEDLKIVCENIKPQGVSLGMYASSVEEADYLVKVAKEASKKWWK